ncbi:MAG: hypothetical protein K5770_05975, partial [Lachnospiraceae bacterium]|nr:hypothetical protein [Lachnospiraceae bacterium]
KTNKTMTAIRAKRAALLVFKAFVNFLNITSPFPRWGGHERNRIPSMDINAVMGYLPFKKKPNKSVFPYHYASISIA